MRNFVLPDSSIAFFSSRTVTSTGTILPAHRTAVTAEADRTEPNRPERPTHRCSLGRQCVRACVAAAIYRSKYANQCTVATHLPTGGGTNPVSATVTAAPKTAACTIRCIGPPLHCAIDRSVESPIRRATARCAEHGLDGRTDSERPAATARSVLARVRSAR